MRGSEAAARTPRLPASAGAAARTLLVSLALGAGVCLIAVLASLAPLDVQQTVLYALILMVMVLSLYTFSGLSGILSFGHLAFVAVGAYVAALLTIPPTLKQSLFAEMPGALSWVLDVQAGFIPATLAGGLVAAVLAAVLSVPIARISGMAAAIATLAFLVVVQTVLLHWDQVTRGSSSVIGVPQTTGLINTAALIFVVLLAIGVFQASRTGLRLRASRSDEPAAQGAGVNIESSRRLAMVLSGFIAGMAGALFAQFNTTFSPGQFYLGTTFTIVAMLVIGGMTSMTGAVTGVIAVTVLKEGIQYLHDHEIGPAGAIPDGATEVLVAVALILILISRPAGLMGGKELSLPAALRRIGTRRGGVEKEG